MRLLKNENFLQNLSGGRYAASPPHTHNYKEIAYIPILCGVNAMQATSESAHVSRLAYR